MNYTKQYSKKMPLQILVCFAEILAEILKFLQGSKVNFSGLFKRMEKVKLGLKILKLTIGINPTLKESL